MVITLTREIFTPVSTIGKLEIQGQTWWTIEDMDRGLYQTMTIEEIKEKKVYGKTAIPYGTYPIWITRSNRFSTIRKSVYTPQLMNVKGFEGIRIHKGNYATELEGCIAPGLRCGVDAVYDSKTAYGQILAMLNETLKSGTPVDIQIIK